MKSSIRPLARPLLMFTALVLLIGALIQPVIPSHAQESDPPVPPTAGPPQGGQPAATPSAGVALKSDPAPDNTSAVSAGTSQELVRPAVPVADHAAALATSSDATAPAQIKPQATQPVGTFQVNIVSSATVAADGLLTYSIYFTNTASVTYQNVILQNGIGGAQRYTGCDNAATCPFTYTGDLVRPTILSGAGNSGSYDPRTLVWSLGNVLSGKKGRISYTVRVWRDLYPQSDRPVAVLGNTVALYDGGAINQDRMLNQDQWGVLVVGPVFNFSKTVDKPVALQRERISYTISLGNKTHPNDLTRVDARDAHNAQIIDIVPSTLDPDSIIVGDAGRKEIHGSDIWVIWDIPLLTIGSTVVRHFSATIKDTLSECNAVDNDRYFATSDEFPFNEQGYQISIRGPNARTYIAPPVALDVQIATPGPIYVGDTVTYVVNAKNNLDTLLNGATIVFYLPPDFSYASSTPSGAYDLNTKTVTWSNVSIPPKVNFDTPGLTQFTVKAVAGRKIDSNRAYAEFITPLPGNIPSGCLRKVERNVDIQPLLYANKSVETGTSSTWVLSGTDVIYTVELINISSQPMTNVSLVDDIPAPPGGPFLYKGMVSGQAPNSTTSSQLRWDGNLQVPAATSSTAPGRTTLRFTMTVRGRPNECRDNRILPDSPPSQAREVFGGRVCIAFPWNVRKDVNIHAISPRDANRRLTFTLTFESLVATDVNMTPKDEFLARARDYPYIFDRMVKGPDPINKIPDGNFRLNWPPIILHGHETVVYQFEVLLPLGTDGLIPTGTYCNRSILWPNGPEYDYFIFSVPDACTTVSSLELHVGKWLDRHDVGLGELVTYGVNLSNQSDSPVSQLVVSDTLPVNVSYVKPATGSLPPTVTELPNGRQLLRWENVLVPAHGTTTVSFQARAPALIGSYRNVAEVSGGNPAPAFTCDYGFSTSGGCQGAVDLNVTNLVTIDPQPTPASAQPGEIVTYNLTVLSNNNIPYLQTTITDTLPLGFTFVEMVSGPAAPYRPRPDVLIWTGQTVPPRDGNNAGRLTYVFRAKAPLSYGSFRSRVEASSPTGIIPTVDNAGRVLIVPPNPALSLVAPSLVQIGSDVTFRISLVNPQATPLTGVTINHALPAGFIFKSVGLGTPAPTPSGQTLTWSNVTVPAQAQDGTPGIVELLVIATAPNTEGTARSTVTASGGSATIDQTYNKVDMIVAELRYIFMPFISTPG